MVSNRLSHVHLNFDDDDLDGDFINARGVIHHSLSVGFDANMTEILASCSTPTCGR